MSKKIAFFIRSLHLGGAEKQSILLVEELSKFYEVYLVVLNKEGKLIARTKNIKNIIFLEGNFLRKITQLFLLLKNNQINFLFNFLPVNNILGSIIGKIAGVNYIFNGIRGAKIKKSIVKMKLQLFLSNYIVSGVISNSHKGRISYANYGYKIKKITVIHNIIENYKSARSLEKNKKIKILSVGRFVKEKDYPTMLKAISELVLLTENKLYNDWELVIVGYGALELELKSIVKGYNLTNRVRFLPGDNIKVKEQYFNSDIYISTSKYEGLSNTIMEAMSYGIPVIATDAGDSSYLVKDNYNGFVCQVSDYESISCGLLKLLKSENLRVQLGANSIKVLEKDFSKESIIKKYIKIIEQ